MGTYTIHIANTELRRITLTQAITACEIEKVIQLSEI